MSFMHRAEEARPRAGRRAAPVRPPRFSLRALNRVLRSAALAPAVLATAPRAALAWGHVGHEVIAMIAQDRLDSGALARIQQILGPGVTLDMISACADQIRDASVNCGGAFQVPMDKASSGWHFIDIPISDSPSASSLEQYCRKGKGSDCVVDQVRAQAAALADPRATRQQQQIALMFLVHFVGDEHQPLHCAEEIDAGGKSDYGGNAKPIHYGDGAAGPSAAAALSARSSPPPEPPAFAEPPAAQAVAGAPPARDLSGANLHHFWDNIVRTDPQERGLDPRALANKLEGDMNRQGVLSWTQGDYASQAALESFAIARDSIYPEYAADRGDVGPAYEQKYQQLAERQIEKAGLRLAAILQQALGNAARTGPQSPPQTPSPKPPRRRATPVPSI